MDTSIQVLISILYNLLLTLHKNTFHSGSSPKGLTLTQKVIHSKKNMSVLLQKKKHINIQFLYWSKLVWSPDKMKPY